MWELENVIEDSTVLANDSVPEARDIKMDKEPQGRIAAPGQFPA